MGMMISNPSIEQQEEFYNHRWKNERLSNLKLQRCIQILKEFQRLNFQNPNIIELGCGTGWLSNILSNWGEVTGIDLSIEAIERSKQRFPSVNFICADISKKLNSQKAFDLVISHEVIEHLSDQKHHLELACDLLRNGGALILTTPNKYIFSSFSKKKQLEWSNQPIENWLSQSDLRKLIPPGLQIEKLTTIVPGYDPKGILRYLNSYKLRKVINKLQLSNIYNEFLLELGWGLHILLVAKKLN